MLRFEQRTQTLTAIMFGKKAIVEQGICLPSDPNRHKPKEQHRPNHAKFKIKIMLGQKASGEQGICVLSDMNKHKPAKGHQDCVEMDSEMHDISAQDYMT